MNVWICFFAGPLINAKSTKDQKEPGQSKRRREDWTRETAANRNPDEASGIMHHTTKQLLLGIV